MASEIFDIKEVCERLGISRRQFIQDYLEKDWIRPVFRYRGKFLYVSHNLVKFFYGPRHTHSEAISSLFEKNDDRTYKEVIPESSLVLVQEDKLHYFDEDIEYLTSPKTIPKRKLGIKLDTKFFKTVTIDGSSYSFSNCQQSIVKFFYERHKKGQEVVSQEEYKIEQKDAGDHRIDQAFKGKKKLFQRLFKKIGPGCYKLNLK